MVLDEKSDVIHAEGEFSAAVDPAEERRLVRKIDRMVMPFICITYLVTYLDKATIGYAAVFNLQSDLHLVGTQFSWLGSIFYFGYLVFEYPSSFAMQKLSVSKWMSANLFIWGGITMALGGCNDFPSFAALRFILGALESCSTPAFLLITAMWYKTEEQPVRIGYWSTFLGLANATGGLLAYGIGHIQGSLQSWRYQFIIIGAASSAWGLFMFFTLAENALSARWLSDKEKRLAVERLRENHTGLKNTKIKPEQLLETALDPKTWFFILFGLSTQVVNGAVSNFGSLIVQGFGFSSLNTTLLQVPYGFIILFSNLSAMYLQKWLPGQRRCAVAVLYVLPALAGTVGIHVLPRSNRGGLLTCYYLTACYTASFAMIMSFITANTAGSTKRSATNAAFFISYCVGNIIGPFAFKSDEAPVYTSGIIAILVAYCVEIGLLISFAIYIIWLNRAKEAERTAMQDASRGEPEGVLDAFGDKTDKQNPYFRYVY
ncbi:MFS general substrate transporter [Thozetella sp. PMI_491]|nr:MFS general substrate transporter [Thozetella sp. PMI_491]